jgi:hypothetical protein
MAVAIDEFKPHGVGTKSRFKCLSIPGHEWIERGKALAVVLLILVLGLVSGLAFGANGVFERATAATSSAFR